MLSNFYKRHSLHLLWLVGFSFPFLLIKADSIPQNNDIETWLPHDAEVRTTYEQFKQDFGIEELIVIGVDAHVADERLLESLASRLDNLDSIRKCWTPQRMRELMTELGVTQEEADERLQGLLTHEEGKLVGLIALLSATGLKDRVGTVAAVQNELNYCQLRGDDVCLSGAPVIVTELDNLGSQQAGRKFFLLTLAISLGLLYYSIRHWGLAFSILGLTVWGINLTQAIICICGGEMNFILGALAIMVMVFTFAIAIHFLSYYTAALEADKADPVGVALKNAWKPCCLATLTTLIGLLSLTLSNIRPVSQFGYSAGLGSVVALLTGLGLTPALLSIWPRSAIQCNRHAIEFERLGSWLSHRSRWVTGGMAVVLSVMFFGLLQLKTDIDPVEFLPRNGKVLSDLRRIERELTNIDSIEGVVDFKDDPSLPFIERLNRVRELEQRIQQHPCVRHTISLASFFPEELPENPLAVVRLLKQAQSHSGENEYLAEGDRLWRISARIDAHLGRTQQQVFADLEQMTAGSSIHFTGIAPLLEHAQMEIFTGFWESFSTAFLIISGVMILSLWSMRAGLVAMVPNLSPIWFVFGIIGWMKIPVDIGMMMSGSIALGIAVDGTFHFLIRYQEHYRKHRNSEEAARLALNKTGSPLLNTAVISSVGMLALGLSNFAPTARFGMLMSALLAAALVGDTILLPALLCLRPRQRREGNPVHAPHHAGHEHRRVNLRDSSRSR